MPIPSFRTAPLEPEEFDRLAVWEASPGCLRIASGRAAYVDSVIGLGGGFTVSYKKGNISLSFVGEANTLDEELEPTLG